MVVVCGDCGGEVSWWDDVHGSCFPNPFFSFLGVKRELLYKCKSS